MRTRLTAASQTLEAKPQGTARFNHARSRYPAIKLNLRFLGGTTGTRLTEAAGNSRSGTNADVDEPLIHEFAFTPSSAFAEASGFERPGGF